MLTVTAKAKSPAEEFANKAQEAIEKRDYLLTKMGDAGLPYEDRRAAEMQANAQTALLSYYNGCIKANKLGMRR